MYPSKRQRSIRRVTASGKKARKPAPDILTAYEDDRSLLGSRRAVCKTCHRVMNDCEPFAPRGEFYHPTVFKDLKKNPCKNAGKTFYGGDPEIEPFMRKRTRRRAKRMGVR